MRAARLYEVGKPLIIEKIPDVSPANGEVLIKVMACGICGSDLHIAVEGSTQTSFKPITIGHEPSGLVACVGPGVTNFKPGDRVAICPLLSCGRCKNCKNGKPQICIKRSCIGVHLNGALAEYLLIPAENLIFLPDCISFEQGAIITDAVATPYHALFKTGFLRFGETVAIYGCGGLGIHAVQLARLGGASLIIGVDVRKNAIKKALRAGADLVVNAERSNPKVEIKKMTGGYGVDLAVELVGSQSSIDQAIKSVRPGGRVSVAGLGSEPIKTISPNEFVRSEVSLLGSYGFTVHEISEIIQLVVMGRLNLAESVSLTMPLDQINMGINLLKEKKEDFIRIVVLPNS